MRKRELNPARAPPAEKALAGSERAVNRPQNWDKWVSCAFIRGLGGTQEHAARAAGVGVRTLARWEKDSRWHGAQAEAHQRWLQNLDAEVRAGLLERVRKAQSQGNDELLRWYAERRWPEFAPPAQRVEAKVEETRQFIVQPPLGLMRGGARAAGGGIQTAPPISSTFWTPSR